MSFYWGRTLGRAAEEAKPVFEATEAFNHARNPRTGRRSNWNDFQGWSCRRATIRMLKRRSRLSRIIRKASLGW